MFFLRLPSISGIDARLLGATHDFVVASHHVGNCGISFVLGTWIGASGTGMGGILAKTMCTTVIHAHFTGNNNWSSCGSSSDCSSSDCSSIGQSRDDVGLVCTMESGSSGGELAEALFVLEVEMCREIGDGVFNDWLVTPSLIETGWCIGTD
jgi:hypothetical protein